MTYINSYLTFNGNCREAMNFYRDCLGGELIFQSIGESPMAKNMPLIMSDKILHAVLTSENIVIMGTDMVEEKGLIKGNSVSLMLNCDSEEDTKIYYEKLSSGGKATHPLQKTFWGSIFGNLVDRFGNNWLINYDKIYK
ncbi:VOC family protein [Pedobacter chinensis]|uniref:VOC family protein n=1 Tax=Pedobacter chinensis TaxID=2282421 RepID=A0A369PTF6_9SPHI|nr:VOC family protein [Pedobacter chinensis]RDC54525.1 VOC family protein [Pedobacter chinensis]